MSDGTHPNEQRPGDQSAGGQVPEEHASDDHVADQDRISGRDTEAEVDPQVQSRQSAQRAAGDLERMGIDPRSLGLEGPGVSQAAAARGPASSTGHEVADEGETAAQVLPLRPEFAQSQTTSPASPPPPATPPSMPQQPAPSPVGPGPVELMLARAASQKPAPRNPARLVKAVTLGLITPDAAEATGHERELVAALRQRQTERRIVTFMSGKGGVGTTTVASGVGTAFAALREDSTVLIDAQPGSASLAAMLNATEGVSVRALLSSPDETVAAETGSGLGVVDGVGWEQPLQRRDLIGLVDRVGADHSFTFLDVGNDPGEAAHAALARCDQAVVVSAVGEVGIGGLQVALARLRQVNPLAAERAVHVVVCQHDAAYRDVHREVVARLATAPARVVVMPPDPSLQAGQAFDPGLVASSTRSAMLEIGAALALSGDHR